MRQSLSPPFLAPGDGVAMVSVSRFAESAVVEQAEAWIREQGWVPYRSPHLGARDHQYGGTDAQRASDVNWAIAQPNVRAIWCIRGGYGAVRMVDQIDWEALQRSPKWLIGFSDFTTILGTAFQHHLCAVHSWMPIQRPEVTLQSVQYLAQLLSGNIPTLRAPAHPLHRLGAAEGPLFGGNLSVLYSLLGSPSFPDLRGCVLALEDLDEYRYHLDRMMWGLRRAGVLDGIIGVALGAFSDIKDHATPFGQEPLEIISEAVPRGIPMGLDMPFGHLKMNEPFVTGYRYRLEVHSGGATLSPCNPSMDRLPS